MNVVQPRVSADDAYDQRVRNLDAKRRIELENLPADADLSTLNGYDRGIVEAFRKTTEWSGAQLHQDRTTFHCQV